MFYLMLWKKMENYNCENYYLQEKVCNLCKLSKILLCFTPNHNQCKACLNADRMKKRRKLGCQEKKYGVYRYFKLERNL